MNNTQIVEIACLWKTTYVIPNPGYVPLHREDLPTVRSRNILTFVDVFSLIILSVHFLQKSLVRCC